MHGSLSPIRETHAVQISPTHDSLLTRLVSRLEAATSRLEDIATSSAPDNALPTTNGVSAGTPSGPAVVATNSQALTPTPSATPGSPIPKVVEELPAMLEDFDGLINGDLKAYHELSKAPAIGGLIGEQVYFMSGIRQDIRLIRSTLVRLRGQSL